MSLQVDPNNPGHLWTGMDNTAPPGTTTASDTIGLVQQNTNMIPDKSWVVNLFEIFTPGATQGVLELDLISEYTGKTRFVAIAMGNNLHYFAIPVVRGHLYRRTITIDLVNTQVVYFLRDTTTGMSETFPFPLPPGVNQIADVFRGIEWHNLQGTTTFPVSWVVSLSPSVSFSTGSQVSPSGYQNLPQPLPSPSQDQVPTSHVPQMQAGSVLSIPGFLLLGGILVSGLLLWVLLSSF